MESVPFKAFDGVIDALSRHLRRLDRADAAMLMPRDVRTLGDIFPALGRLQVVERARSRPAPIDAFERRKRAGFALKEPLARIADDVPLVLWVDDVQWADRDSVGLLRDIAMPPDAPRMLFVVSHRPEGGDFVDGIQRLVETEPALEARALGIGPLEPEAARALARRTLGSASIDGTVEATCADAEGSPLFIVELAHALASSTAALDGVGGLDDLLRLRVQALDAEARDLLELVCLAGRPIDPAVLTAAGAREGGRDVSRLLRALRAARWIRRSAGTRAGHVEPYHDRVREVVIAATDAERMRAHHRSLAWALVASNTDDPAALVHHLEAAGERAQAFDQALRGADRAADALAFEQAAALYERVLALQRARCVAPQHSIEPGGCASGLSRPAASHRSDRRHEPAARPAPAGCPGPR